MAVAERLDGEREVLISLTADIIVAYVSHNTVNGTELPALIKDIYQALKKTGGDEESASVEVVVEQQKPAVNPKRSVTDDYLICLEDGRRFKSLKRHLITHYDLTPEQYREKWNLSADYPMVAPNYAKERARLAKNMGFGRKINAGRFKK